MEACEILQNSLRGVQRRRISNWRGYIYKLIRQVDESAYHEMKESREKEKENGTRRRSKKTNEGNEENAASAPSKKEFNKGATEFIPGKPWKTPEVLPKTLRKDAAEFVPTAAQPAPIFPPPLMPLPGPAAPFPNITTPAWTASNGAGHRKTAQTPMKPDAQEFFPGVSAWAGAMVMPKGKAKAKVKPKGSPSRAPANAAQPVSPGLLSGGRDTDTAGGTSPSQSSPVVLDPAKQDKVAISDGCRKAFASLVVPKGKSKGCQVTGVLTAPECQALLACAQQRGFSLENRAGGASGRLVTKDPWLAEQLWKRLSGLVPCIIKGKKVLGIQDDMFLQCGARGAAVADGSVALQVCLDSSQLSAGDAFILTAPEAGPTGAWLTALMHCGKRSWLSAAQEALGLGGPAPERRLRLGALTLVASLASMLVVLRGQKRLK
ncbi:unnamed protein product [Durusdinium trenchii]